MTGVFTNELAVCEFKETNRKLAGTEKIGRISLRAVARLCCVWAVAGVALYAQNPIQVENANPGTPNWQLSNPATAREIEGFASLPSVNIGGSIGFYVSTRDTTFNIEFFRSGWYSGVGARLLGAVNGLKGTLQDTPAPDPKTGMVECRWTSSYTLTVPANWTSGVYLARLTGNTSGKQSYMIFVVRDDARRSDLLYELSITTFVAYNFWPGGSPGKSLYGWAPGGRAWKVSFNRPFVLGYSYSAGVSQGAATGVGAGEYLTNLQPGPYSGNYPIPAAGFEYNMVRWLEKNGYDLTYATNVDLHENGNLPLSHKGFLSVGHNEYWTMQMRQSVQNALSKGVNLGFFSANTMYWQVRLENGYDGSADRTLVCYKTDAAGNDPFYSTNPQLTTTEFRNSPVNLPEAALVGVEYVGDPWTGDVVVSNATHWLFNGTGLKNGDHLPGILGYEVDAMVPGVSPPQVQVLASSPVGPFVDTDDPVGINCYGGCFSNVIWYPAGNASVFSTGTIQWAWGLDDYNAPGLRPTVSNAAVQQITRNVLASFINPITITSSSTLAAATASQSYGYTFTARGGNGNLTWRAAALPPGLSISPGGTLSGVPLSAGNATFTVTALDAAGNTVSGQFSLTVNRAMVGISGHVRSGTAGLNGVKVSLNGSSTVMTDASGSYSFQVAGGQNYTVAPSLNGTAFNPAQQTFTGVTQDQVADFSAVGGSSIRAISIDFSGSATAMAASETAGVVSKANWNNAAGNQSSSALSLLDETGAVTGATATWSSDNVWSTPIGDVPGNYRMMKGYLDTGAGNPDSVSVANLPYSATGYDIYVYVDGDNDIATKDASYTISGAGITASTVKITDVSNVNFNGNYQQASGSAGNYVKFTIQATGFTLTGTPGQATNGNPRAPINGIQIVPATATQAPPTAISLDFQGSGTPMAATETAGVVAKANWNGLKGNASTSPVTLVDEFGTATGATVAWNSDNNWSLPIADSPGSTRMMIGYLDTGANHPTTVSVTGLPSSSTGYDIYVYVDGDNALANKTAAYSISGAGITTVTGEVVDGANVNFSGTFVQSNGGAGNYVKFSIQGTAFTLTATGGAADNQASRAPVNGIQIVPSPAGP